MLVNDEYIEELEPQGSSDAIQDASLIEEKVQEELPLLDNEDFFDLLEEERTEDSLVQDEEQKEPESIASEEDPTRPYPPKSWEKWMGAVFQGDVFDFSKLYAYWPFIAALIIAFCINITNNFVMIGKKKKVSDMEKFIEELQHKQLAITNELSQKSRSLDVEYRVKSLGIHLEVSDMPPIYLYHSKDANNKKDRSDR